MFSWKKMVSSAFDWTEASLRRMQRSCCWSWVSWSECFRNNIQPFISDILEINLVGSLKELSRAIISFCSLCWEAQLLDIATIAHPQFGKMNYCTIFEYCPNVRNFVISWNFLFFQVSCSSLVRMSRLYLFLSLQMHVICTERMCTCGNKRKRSFRNGNLSRSWIVGSKIQVCRV